MRQIRARLRDNELRQSRYQRRVRLDRLPANIVIWLRELAWESRRIIEERPGLAAKQR
ncbi:MAG: hypothetical protein O7H41_16550 [Planctomycetota bacterium]|nr:hypothetical protein [Planctomycetota bacterium]